MDETFKTAVFSIFLHITSRD